MKKIAFTSARNGGGKTTIIVNLASGLAQRGKSVLLLDMDNNDMLYKWLEIEKPVKEAGIISSCMGIDLFAFPDKIDINIESFSLPGNLNYDYLFIEADAQSSFMETAIGLADIVVVVSDLISEDEPGLIIELDKRIQNISGGKHNINLLLPSRINAKEWENNSKILFTLAEYFDYEKIADLIPSCAAIADLPELKKTVWDLPAHYQNRKNAFERLLQRLEEL